MRTRVGVLAIIALWAATASHGQSFPDCTFVDRTAASGIRFGLHRAPALPGLFPDEQGRYGAGGAVSDFDRDGDL
ncbi:MAG: hypothetical protein KDC38_21390, partial [Planctomycetes bacterium]|nr:hypothetical protein [Planctomycetota bacterium]